MERITGVVAGRSGARGKLVVALSPWITVAAVSYAQAASSAVPNVPSHTLSFTPIVLRMRISAAYFPHGRLRTPRNRGSAPSTPPAFLFLPAANTTLAFAASAIFADTAAGNTSSPFTFTGGTATAAARCNRISCT